MLRPCSLASCPKRQPEEKSQEGFSDGPTTEDGTRADVGTGRALDGLGKLGGV